MPISLPVAILLSGAGAAGASVVGAKMGAGASKHASDVEGKSAQEALDFLKKQYEELQPYRDLGFGSIRQLSDLLGLPPAQQRTTSAAAPPATPPPPPPANGGGAMGAAARAAAAANAGQQQQAAPPAAPPGGGGGMGAAAMATTHNPMVTMVAPDGSQQQVPAAFTNWYQARGAKVVN